MEKEKKADKKVGQKSTHESAVEKKSLKYKITAVAELLILLALILGIPAYLILINPQLWHNFTSMDAFEAFMDRHSRESVPIYLACQAVIVIVTILPGQVVQMAGGFIYGFLKALILSMIGVILGSTISFNLARIIGQRPMNLIFGEEKFTKYKDMLDTRQAHRVIFLLYLVPGLPKDMIAYAAGISRIKYPSFMFLSLAGRLPATCASLLMGTLIHSRNITGAVILAAVVGIIVIICIFKRNAIMNFTDKYYDKIDKAG